MTTVNNAYCDKCAVRIPKHRPRLACSICCELKHIRCQALSKTDALNILSLDTDWICKDCIVKILPINACNNKVDKKQRS